MFEEDASVAWIIHVQTAIKSFGAGSVFYTNKRVNGVFGYFVLL